MLNKKKITAEWCANSFKDTTDDCIVLDKEEEVMHTDFTAAESIEDVLLLKEHKENLINLENKYGANLVNEDRKIVKNLRILNEIVQEQKKSRSFDVLSNGLMAECLGEVESAYSNERRLRGYLEDIATAKEMICKWEEFEEKKRIVNELLDKANEIFDRLEECKED